MRLSFLLLLMLAALAARAQPADPVPALRHALALAESDSLRGRLCWALSENSERNDSTIYFAQQAIGLLEHAAATAQGTERRRLLRLLGGAVNNLAVGYSDGGDESHAKTLYLRAATLRQQSGDVRGQVEALWNLANTYESQGDYATALRYYQQGAKAGAGVAAARSQHAECLSSMGNLYGLLGDHAAPLRYQLQALALLERGGEPLVRLRNLNTLAATCLDDYADTARAEAYAGRAQRLALQTAGGRDALVMALMLRADIRLRQRRLPAARALLQVARVEAIRGQAVLRLASVQNAQAGVEEAAGNLPLALQYVRQTLAYGQRNLLDNACQAERIVAQLLEKTGQPAAALAHYRRYILLRDSSNNEANKKQTLAQHLSAGYALQAAQLKAAQAQHQAVAAAEIKRLKLLRTATSIGAVLLLLLAAGLYNRFRFQRRARRAIELQKERVEREKQRSDELLRNILPAEVAEELMDTGRTTARFFDVVTVLFADVVDFTQLAETLTPQQLVATLDTYFRAFDAITGRFGLEKIKTIGDAYMLAGGLGQGDTADPAAVVRAALAMHAVVEQLRAERAPQGLPCFALRIGLHTGPVVAGVVGVRKFAYDIWGDTVNTASRMESAGVGGKVNISEDTHRLVADRFVCTPRGKLAAKHKGEIEMYFVEGEGKG